MRRERQQSEPQGSPRSAHPFAAERRLTCGLASGQEVSPLRRRKCSERGLMQAEGKSRKTRHESQRCGGPGEIAVGGGWELGLCGGRLLRPSHWQTVGRRGRSAWLVTKSLGTRYLSVLKATTFKARITHYSEFKKLPVIELGSSFQSILSIEVHSPDCKWWW